MTPLQSLTRSTVNSHHVPVIATSGAEEIRKRITEIDEYNDELTVRGLLRVGRGNLGAE